MSEEKPKIYPPGFWEVWPLLMTLSFVCMQQPHKFGHFILQSVTVVLITYSLALRICRFDKRFPK